MAVNLRRPIKKVEQWPLALLDVRSIEQDDVHPTVLQTFDHTPGGQAGMDGKKRTGESTVVDENGGSVTLRRGEVLTPLHDPRHRWVLFPDMVPEEVLLLKVFDSRRQEGAARSGCHSAVFDPTRTTSALEGSIYILDPNDFHSKVVCDLRVGGSVVFAHFTWGPWH
jgi:hypothetical protein